MTTTRKQLSGFVRGTALAPLFALTLLATACGNYGGDEEDGAFIAAPAPPSSGGGGPTTAELEAAFATTVHPILTNATYTCRGCHVGGGSASPAISDMNVTTAFRAVWDNQKVNLSTPANSRLVRRLSSDQHHCWSNDCLADANLMESAIRQWAQLVNWGGAGTGTGAGGGTTVGTGTLVSTNLTLADGFEDQGQERYSAGAIAYYDFKDGTGTTAADSSGVAPAANLTLEGETTLMSSYGINIETGRAIAPAATARKLYDRIASAETGSQQYTVEAWVTPLNTTQGGNGSARIFTYGGDVQLRQRLYQYEFTNNNIVQTTTLQTLAADQDLQARLQHVVITYDRYRGRRIYVDAKYTDDMDEVEPLALWDWSPNSALTLGRSAGNNNQWQGQVRLLAVYDRALTEAQIKQNYDAGVGKRLLLRFDVSAWAGAGSFLEFMVTELDDFSYLFCTPSLSSSVMNARVGGIRILVNGVAPVSGQAFTNIDRIVTSTRETLSPQCSIIRKDQGPMSDVFTIDFEYLAGFNDPEIVPPPPPLPPRQFVAALPVEGLRDFAKVNAAMAAVTGVDPLTPAVDATYQTLTRQMPPTYDLRTFASAQQVAITKLSLEYCDALVESPTLRSAFFGNTFDFDAPPATAFAAQASRDQVSQAITDRILGANLTTQPSMVETGPILDALITDLTAGCGTTITCTDGTRTRTVVKAMCTAAIASAAASVH
jgi:hypothetical protein